MRRFHFTWVIGLVTLDVCACMVVAQPQGLSDAVSCDTIYIGPPDGDWRLAANWNPVIPGANDVTCFPGQATADSVNLPGNLTVRIIAGSEVMAKGAAAGPNPPPVGAIGACCTGSQCIDTDYFDCRELGGFFKAGIGVCVPGICATGACCRESPECADDDGLGNPMDESLVILTEEPHSGHRTSEH